MRPSLIAVTIVEKLSSARTMLAASLLTSVPVIPMAIPMSAFLSAGASFTPSPVTATISFSSFNKVTILSLCSGLTRANIMFSFLFERFFFRYSSDMLFNSMPVMILCSMSSLIILSCFAMASAVRPWSPVII